MAESIVDPFEKKQDIIDPFEIAPEPSMIRTPTPVTTWEGVPGYFKGAIKNIPESGHKLIESLTYPFTHSPQEAAKSITEIGKNIFELTVDVFKERYGSPRNFLNTFYKDPLGVLMDASIVYAPLEPFRIAGQAMSGIKKGMGKTLKEGLGITTGVGAKGMEIAYKGGTEFKQAMRGQIGAEEILTTAEEGFSTLRNNRTNKYVQRLEGITQLTGNLDISPIRNHLETLMGKYNIKRTTDAKGNPSLDFSRSTLDRKAILPMRKLIEKVDSWGTQAGDLTPKGLDILKRMVDDYYMPTNNSRAFTSSLRNTVKNTLVKAVPEYKTMVADYEKITEVLNDIRNSFSLGKGNADTVIQRLTNAIKRDKDFARILIEELDNASAGNLTEMLAGYSMKPYVAPGAYGKIVTGVSALTALGTLDPRMATILVTGSPRIVGELTNALGVASKYYSHIGKLEKYRRVGTQAVFQTGRIEQKGETIKGGGGGGGGNVLGSMNEATRDLLNFVTKPSGGKVLGIDPTVMQTAMQLGFNNPTVANATMEYLKKMAVENPKTLQYMKLLSPHERLTALYNIMFGLVNREKGAIPIAGGK